MPLSSLLCIFPENPTHRIPHSIPSEPLLLVQSLQFTGPEMGVFGCSRFFNFSVSLFFFFSLCLSTSMADDGRNTSAPSSMEGDISTTNLQPTPPSASVAKSNITPFRPSIAVIVGVLTTMFSITFLLLLYAKHCKRSSGFGGYAGNQSSGFPGSYAARRNSGIDRSVIESLPIFRFGSLRGHKEGLECAVCLTRFETTEVLRLLPKCKHAFHVECVDTWLDAHSTCPLCRYRVDPEDVLLVDETKLVEQNEQEVVKEAKSAEEKESPHSVAVVVEELQKGRESGPGSGSETRGRNSAAEAPAPAPAPAPVPAWYRRISGRHSSAGERTSRFMQIVVHRPSDSEAHDSRRSLDSASLRKKKESVSSVSVGCFDRGRKDRLLLPESTPDRNRESLERRLEHRIIISAGNPTGPQFEQRWSDLQPSDLLFLRSEMIITESGRYSASSGSRPSISSPKHQRHNYNRQQRRETGIDGNGRSVINSRSVSEITGLSRFSNRTSSEHNQSHHQGQERKASVVNRWLAWASQLRRT